MSEFQKGDKVEWSSHGGTAVGTVEIVRSEKSGGTAVHQASALRRRS